MSDTASITGVVGKIEWSYYVAAAINGYTVTRSKDKSWSLRATVVLADSFKLRQRPLMFVAPHERGEWRWPIEAMTFNPETKQIAATLGVPVE